jgi:TonB family protein
MLRRILGLTMAVALAAGATGVAGAQSTAANERTLLERAAQNPQEIVALLDLARLYVEQSRFDEADQMLRRASLALQRARGLTGQERSRPAATFQPSGEPVRVGGDILEPRKIRDVRPVYPDIARAANVQGIVIVEVTIDEFGTVGDARVLRSVPLLDEAALDAVRQWAFQPTLLNGVPTPVVMTVTVNFSLN